MSRILLLLVWMGVASGLAFLALFLDKQAAARGRSRIPERTLHILELLGGWPGTLLAMRLVRHKSRKLSYRLVTAGILLLHAALGYAAWKSGWMEG